MEVKPGIDAVRIQVSVLAGIARHARDEAPLECCGILVGGDDLIDEYVSARNSKASAVAYQIEPADHFAAIRSVRARGRAIVGAYHSHPRTPALLSPTDLAEAHDPDLLYVIVSLLDEPPDIRAYRVDAGTFVEVPVIAVP
jgi:proteasome lid subunit RPN8/RPN11